jgi:L-glutamine---4-(methylsulfanyl)-2-oxobutanoate aminotransferase
MSVADRMNRFGTTIFAEMTQLAIDHGAINLGQGFPNWPGADFVKDAAIRSISGGRDDQYPPTAGIPSLREAIAGRYGPLLGRTIDSESEVTVTSGCTEALAASFLGLVNPGEEVVLIEPYYDAYPAYVAMAGAVPRFIRLRAPGFALDFDELHGVFNARTKAIVLNNPHNPTGRVFSIEELRAIAKLCLEFDVMVIADEVYEEMTYGEEHVRIATLPGMWDRTLTLSSLGKTFSLTGWKLGWAVGPANLTAGLRSAHQFLTFTTPTPMQHGAVAAMDAPKSFFEELRSSYQFKRDLLSAGMQNLGFDVHVPQGTYFLMAGFEAFGFDSDREFARHMAENVGVVAIPPSVFYDNPMGATNLVRFAFCKDESTLILALDRLSALSPS